ncbi:hypothetical protein BC830DRAFT_1142519 [Chytriomyces sp. MP71]|nr:hypothetical protein BC830DRAFT_1142519 [Chytriomyces sp. MP71]
MIQVHSIGLCIGMMRPPFFSLLIRRNICFNWFDFITWCLRAVQRAVLEAKLNVMTRCPCDASDVGFSYVQRDVKPYVVQRALLARVINSNSEHVTKLPLDMKGAGESALQVSASWHLGPGLQAASTNLFDKTRNMQKRVKLTIPPSALSSSISKKRHLTWRSEMKPSFPKVDAHKEAAPPTTLSTTLTSSFASNNRPELKYTRSLIRRVKVSFANELDATSECIGLQLSFFSILFYSIILYFHFLLFLSDKFLLLS